MMDKGINQSVPLELADNNRYLYHFVYLFICHNNENFIRWRLLDYFFIYICV